MCDSTNCGNLKLNVEHNSKVIYIHESMCNATYTVKSVIVSMTMKNSQIIQTL